MENNGKPIVNPAHILARKLKENKGSLHIARVPDKTKTDFMALAHNEFCDDYGFCLKYLMDNLMTRETALIMTTLEEHESRLQNLESTAFRGAGPTQEPEPKPTGRKMLDGKVKNIGGKPQ